MEQQSIVSELEKWYHTHCNGHWEHYYGVTIASSENAGWKLYVDLDNTELEGMPFEEKEIRRNDRDWLHCTVEGTLFNAEGGPANLQEMVAAFLSWAKKQPVDQQDDLLQRLQAWYAAKTSTPGRQAQQPILVKTLDNPGWSLTAGLDANDLARKPIPHQEIERDDRDWIDIGVEENKFVAAGGPENLREILTKFVSLTS